MLRPELLGIARAHRQPPSYAIDQLVRENGHEVLRLPPYHPDFNAIEIIWSQLKTIIRQKNTTFRLVYIFCIYRLCEQYRPRSAFVSAWSDQDLRCLTCFEKA